MNMSHATKELRTDEYIADKKEKEGNEDMVYSQLSQCSIYVIESRLI